GPSRHHRQGLAFSPPPARVGEGGRGTEPPLCVYLGEALGRYAFGEHHPFGPHRLPAYEAALAEAGLVGAVRRCAPVEAERAEIERFHTATYVARVRALSEAGHGLLDAGDTPAFPGVYEAAATVVGSVLDAVAAIFAGRCRRAFVPIAGLHHARRDGAAGFCVFNDAGVAIEVLRAVHGVRRIAYVDIDAHHGDGVFYGFESDPEVYIADLHEDGRYLFPGTGAAAETGRGEAAGSKFNIPMPPGADDRAFARAWQEVEGFVERVRPEFILFQCGADGLAGDPLTDLRYSVESHTRAARGLKRLAGRCCEGRLLALGGGGYDLENLGRAWAAVTAVLAGDD
ncbi:MAG TPA: hypothetical protein VKA64_03120, partial [Gammaproteobacteria bacterium]|nr:hypothetical protein [Gammaproteobacteria bacterium]